MCAALEVEMFIIYAALEVDTYVRFAALEVDMYVRYAAAGLEMKQYSGTCSRSQLFCKSTASAGRLL